MMWKIGIFVLCAAVFANASPQKAVAVLKNPTLNIKGVINFEQSEHGIIISGNITGLKPGPHGFHVHEKGDISDPKCMSTGGHFNPFNKHHGAPEDEDRHVGDLGNIIANEDGVAIISIKDNLVSLNAPNCVIGRGVVVHENADDLGKGGFSDSLTTGHAGGRLACGVIGYA